MRTPRCHSCPAGLVTVLTTAFALGCSPTEPPGAVASFTIVSGSAQTGIVGRELPEALVIRAEDANGLPVPQQAVNFVVVSGGGEVFAGSAVTNSAGEARELWTLGTNVLDSQRVEARAVNSQSGEVLLSDLFTATAISDAPSRMRLVSSDWAEVGGPHQATVLVEDRFGNGTPDELVRWSAGTGGTTSPDTSRTQANGRATTQWTIGTDMATVYHATATHGTLGDLELTARPVIPAAAMLSAFAGDAQIGDVWAFLEDSLSVRLHLPDGRPISGAQIRWTGRVHPGSSTTDANGIGSSTWKLGGAIGIDSTKASAQGVEPFWFTAHARPNGDLTIGFAKGYTLYGRTAEGSNIALTQGEDLAWLQGEDRFAFVSNRDQDATHDTQIFIKSLDGTVLERITWLPGSVSGPDVSPDGSTIVFRYAPSSDQEQEGLWTVNVDGTGLEQILRGTHRDPAWSPDGTRIAFVTDEDGARGLRTVHPDGTNLSEVTAPPVDSLRDSEPRWSPDGEALVFVRERVDRRRDLLTVRLDGSELTKLRTHSDIRSPDWSSDGTRIAFSQTPHVYSIDATDGSNIEWLIAEAWKPRWRW